MVYYISCTPDDGTVTYFIRKEVDKTVWVTNHQDAFLFDDKAKAEKFAKTLNFTTWAIAIVEGQRALFLTSINKTLKT